MSIRDEIKARIAEERLFSVVPRLGSSPRSRALLVMAEIGNLLHGPWASERREIRGGALKVDLDLFVEGGLVNKGYLKPLVPRTDEVWEIQSRAPSPSMRVFGSFAEQDVFVATTYAERPLLGGFGSIQWRRAARHHLALWRQLFPTYPPFTGVRIHDYVSENAHDNYHWRD